jgi:hypothetical protein
MIAAFRIFSTLDLDNLGLPIPVSGSSAIAEAYRTIDSSRILSDAGNCCRRSFAEAMLTF